jgi:Zn-dependent protease with chaperone function
MRCRYFDGRSSRPRDGVLDLEEAGWLRLSSGDTSRRWSWRQVEVSQRVGQAPVFLRFPDGSHAEVSETDGHALLERHRGQWFQSLLRRLERHRGFLVVAVPLSLLVFWVTTSVVVPALVSPVAAWLPAGSTAAIGRETLASLDRTWLSPSRLPEGQRQRLDQRFQELVRRLGVDQEPRLVLRSGQRIGPNALAIPPSTVVLTDELVERLKEPDLLAAVMVHELGHLEYRHSLRNILRHASLPLLMRMIARDLPDHPMAGLTLGLDQLRHSRGMEREADAYAVAALARLGLPCDTLQRALRRLAPASPNGAMGFISTHPDTAERGTSCSGR